MSEATQKMPQTSQYTKRRRNEEEIMTKLTLYIKPPTQKQRRTATEEPPWKGQYKNSWCYTRETSKTAFFLMQLQINSLYTVRVGFIQEISP